MVQHAQHNGMKDETIATGAFLTADNSMCLLWLQLEKEEDKRQCCRGEM